MTKRDPNIRYDAEADAAYATWLKAAIVRTDEVADGIMVDYDADDRPVGLEVLSLRLRLKDGDLQSYIRGLADGLFALKRQAAE